MLNKIEQKASAIGTSTGWGQNIPSCCVCGTEGFIKYEKLEDLLFAAPGEWNIRQCNNPKCGLLWLDPLPCEKALKDAYVNYYTHQKTTPGIFWVHDLKIKAKKGYLARRFSFEKESASVVEKTLGILLGLFLPGRDYLDFGFTQMKDLPKGRLLEIGCGNGNFLQLMDRWGWQTEGIDFDHKAVDIAINRGLNVYLGDLQSRHYMDNTFDVVFSSHVVEHVPKPVEWVSESLRILKPGGYLIVVTPNAQSLGHKIFKKYWRGLEPPRHLQVFTPNALNLLLTKSGVIEISCISSARSARRIFSDSFRCLLGARQTCGSLSSVGVETIHFLEWCLVKIAPMYGSELICVAHKKN